MGRPRSGTRLSEFQEPKESRDGWREQGKKWFDTKRIVGMGGKE